MNIRDYDILSCILNRPFVNQRLLSETSGYSLGKVNQSLKLLVQSGYLDDSFCPTDKCNAEISVKKPDNAIILAAGYGLRMAPIGNEIPKGLLTVNDEPLIERLICQLHEAQITNITVIAGFMKEQYEYLMDKYDVELLVNPDYAVKNNIHSLKLALNLLSNTYIIPCDIWCETNPFRQIELHSWYMVSDMIDDESDVRVNRKMELVRVPEGSGGNRMIGISYLLKQDSDIVRQRILKFANNKLYDHRFWEEALYENNHMILPARLVRATDIYEINTFEQLRELDDSSDSLQSDIITLIADTLSDDIKDILHIEVLKKGMTNRSFRFSCNNKRYIMRIPGEGSNQLINRQQEYEVYQVIQGKNICDPIRYINPDTGYKMTEFLENARTCDSNDPEDVRRCMQYLRQFHEYHLTVTHTFDLYENIEHYESLWNGTPSCYRDYAETKAKIYELKKYIDAQPKNWTLTHIDANCDNFLFVPAGDHEEIRLIDWEYAGMQDAHVDIAMFAIYAMYDREQVEALIDSYFPEGCSKEVRLKIYCYIATCGLLWSNWCEYKRILGIDFGEYSLRQYRFAKDYYNIFRKEQ